MVTRANETIFVQGKLRGAVAVPCARCLAPARIDLTAPIRMTYRPGIEVEEVDREVTEDDIDFSTYHGDVIDLGKLFREQILLSLPMQTICREDCKGICPVCGQNRNLAECGCQLKAPDDRWAALRNL